MVPYYLLEGQQHVLSQYLKRLWLPTAALVPYTLGGLCHVINPVYATTLLIASLASLDRNPVVTTCIAHVRSAIGFN